MGGAGPLLGKAGGCRTVHGGTFRAGLGGGRGREALEGRVGGTDRWKSLGLSRSDSWFTGAGVTRAAGWRGLGSDAERGVGGEQRPSRERKVAGGQGRGQWGWGWSALGPLHGHAHVCKHLLNCLWPRPDL